MKELKDMKLNDLCKQMYLFNNEILDRLAKLPRWMNECDCDEPDRVETLSDDSECECFCANCGGGITKW